MRFFIVDGLIKAFGNGNQVLNGLDLIQGTRGIKSEQEVDILRCANEVTKKVIATVYDQLYEGISEDETSSLVLLGLTSAGLKNPWALVLFGLFKFLSFFFFFFFFLFFFFI